MYIAASDFLKEAKKEIINNYSEGYPYVSIKTHSGKLTGKIEDVFHMVFGKDIARGFYSYLLVKNGHGTFATVYGRKNAFRSEEFLQNTINYFSNFLDENDLKSGKKFAGYGHFEVRKNYYDENGAMLIGEAGGFQDYLWGFGTRYAFESANLAARSIIDAESYNCLIKENLLKKLKHSKRNRFLFEILGPLAYPAEYLLAASKNPLALLNIAYR